MAKNITLKEILQADRTEKLNKLNLLGKSLVDELKLKAKKNGHVN